MPKVSLGPWVVDAGPLGNTGVVEAKNVLPHIQGYKPLRQPFAIRTAGSLSGHRIVGATWVDTNNQFMLVVGTAPTATNTLARLYWTDETVATGWVDKTQVTASQSQTRFFEFAKFGNLLIATGGNQLLTPQKITISTGGAGTNFENLGGTPGNARYIMIVRDFVVIGGNATVQNRVKWSALGNAEDWTISATTQSDEQDISSESIITAMVGGEYGLIFSSLGIYRMNYIGPPVIFQFDKIADVGAYPGAVTKLNDNVYFMGPHGFGVVRGGYEAIILSSDSIEQYIGENVAFSLNGGFGPRLAADSKDRIVAISYLNKTMLAGSSDKRTNIIFYDESLDKFSRASLTHQWIFNAYLRKYATAAAFGFSMSQEHLIALIDESNQLAVFEGANMRALIETGEGQLNENGRTFVNKVIPYVSGETAPMVQVGVRERQHQTVSFGATVTANTTNGIAPVRAAGRFHRLRIHMSASASWSFMTGFEVEGRPDGVR